MGQIYNCYQVTQNIAPFHSQHGKFGMIRSILNLQGRKGRSEINEN
jgi:hypothetical protein